MKNVSIILMIVLVMASVAGPVAAQNGAQYGQHSNYADKFYGIIESMPENGYVGIWTINGKNVQVDNNTVFEEKHGKASVGAFAEVKGLRSGDIYAAYKMEIKQGRDFKRSAYPGKFYGSVERLPEQGWQGIWLIDGRDILVTGHTKIEEKYGRAGVGALVKVEGNYMGDKFTAYEIEVKGDRGDRQYTPAREKTFKSKQRDYSARGEKVYNSKFAGTIESIPDAGYEGMWIINGRKVEVNNKTLVDETKGAVSVGAYAKVRGIRTGGTITAYDIGIESVKK